VTRRLVVSAQHIAAGQGGIARVARMSVMALAGCTATRALAVQDEHIHRVGGVEVTPFRGQRWRFAAANALSALGGASVLYDFAGTARVHPPGLRRWSRYAVWVHGVEMWDGAYLRADRLAAVKGAELVLVNSNYTLRRMTDAVGDVPAAQVCWLGTEDDGPAARALPDGPPALLFIGRSDAMFGKGQDILIDVWPDVVGKIPNARLLFAGGGVCLPRLIALAKTSPAASHIDVLGFQSDDDMEKLWRRASAFAMLSHLEGFGLVYAEAMRHGVPVLASTDDASAEVNIDGVTGLNVARTDRGGIVDRIVFLLRERDKAEAMGQAGLARWRDNFRFSLFRERLNGRVLPWLGS
jgi:phosphatidylinositol alpha-1,6-mannosyltransferase